MHEKVTILTLFEIVFSTRDYDFESIFLDCYLLGEHCFHLSNRLLMPYFTIYLSNLQPQEALFLFVLHRSTQNVYQPKISLNSWLEFSEFLEWLHID